MTGGHSFGQLGLSHLSAALSETTAHWEKDQKEKKENIKSINFLANVSKSGMASECCARIEAQIRAFDKSLDQEHEVGMKTVAFGQQLTFHVTSLGYHNPHLIFFHGLTIGGDTVQLIQHVSQISFLLVKLTKLEPDKPKRPFGFRSPDRADKDSGEELGAIAALSEGVAAPANGQRST